MRTVAEIIPGEVSGRSCWFISFGDGMVYVQRRGIATAAESDLDLREQVIVALCDKITADSTSGGT